jgi:hypothetical protein
LAINEWNLDIIKALIEAGAYANANGYRPLHKAAYGWRFVIANMLIATRAEVDIKALCEALKYCRVLDVVKILLQNGIDPKSKDFEGETSLDLARTKEVRVILQESRKKREGVKAKAKESQIFNYSTCFNKILDPLKRRETASFVGDKAWRDGGYKNRHLAMPNFVEKFNDILMAFIGTQNQNSMEFRKIFLVHSNAR